MKNKTKLTIIRITGLYLVFSVLWILFSDKLATLLAAGDQQTFTHIQTYKGIFYVVSSGALLFSLLIGAYRKQEKADKRLRSHYDSLDALMKSFPGAFYRCLNNDQWTMTYISPGILEISGYRPEDLINDTKCSYASIIHPKDRDYVNIEVAQAIQENRPFFITYRIIDIVNNERNVWEMGEIYDQKSSPALLTGFIMEASSMSGLKEQLNKTRSQFQAVFENAPSMIVLFDDQNRILDVNSMALKKSGYTRNELIGVNIADIEEHVESELRTNMDKILHDEDYVTGESSFFDKEGNLIYVSYRITRDIVPNIHLLIMFDISNLKAVQQRLNQQLQHLEAFNIINNSIISNMDLKVVQQIILDQITGQVKIDSAQILLLDPQSLKFEASTNKGFINTTSEQEALCLGEGVAGQAALERKSIEVHNLWDKAVDFTRQNLIRNENFHFYYASPLISEGNLLGMLELFHRSAFRLDEDDKSFIEAVSNQTAIAIDHIRAMQHLKRAQSEVRMAYQQTLEGWASALELRDNETEGHSNRVTSWSVCLAKKFGYSDNETVNIRWGSLLHDIGKMGIPDSILHKPGPLNKEEWEIMKTHPLMAQKILSKIQFLKSALEIPVYHHERWDGSGYPYGLSGVRIPLPARIFAVIDIWDALISERPYRKALPQNEVIDYLQQEAGKTLDPEVVALFLECLQEDIVPD